MTKDKSSQDKEELEDTINTSQETKSTEENTEDTKEATTEEVEEEKEDTVEDLGKKIIEINDRYLRLSAEFDNYRKRTLKEKMELTKSGGEKILINLLPIIDNLERALQSIDTTDDKEAIKEGVNLIHARFIEFIGQNGVKEIEAINKDFDTDVHEAITKIPAPSKKMKGKIVDCVEKGYFLNEKVIRFSKVVVGE